MATTALRSEGSSAKGYGLLALGSILTLHLRVLDISGYELTAGVLGFLVIALHKVSRYPVGAFIFVLLGAGLACAPGFLAGGVWDDQDAVGTAGLIAASAFIAVGLLGRADLATVRTALVWAAPKALLLICALSVLQTVTGAAGSVSLFNVWGDRQYLYEYDPGLSYTRIPRAQGLYLEPSFNAFVIVGLAIACVLTGASTQRIFLIMAAGLLATQSASGFIAVLGAVILALVALRGRGLWAAILVGGILTPYAGTYVWGRLASASDLGSSASYRLTQPVPLIRDVLQSTPFGRPLGSLDKSVSSYGFRMDGQESVATLDNGAYVVVYYLGVLGILALLTGFIILIYRVADPKSRDLRRWLPLYWLMVSLNFSGAIYSPDYVSLVALGFVAAASSPKKEASGASEVKRCNGNLQ